MKRLSKIKLNLEDEHELMDDSLSLMLFGFDSPFRLFVKRIVISKEFELLILFFIII